MDSIKFHDIRSEKAYAISSYRRIQRITIVFRFVEVLIFLIVLSRFSNFPVKVSSEYFREIFITLISPKFVFVIGNVIVIALILISGQFPGKSSDFYDEYVEKCANYNPKVAINKGEKKVPPDAYCYVGRASEPTRYRSSEKKLIRRVQSENHVKAVEEERRHDLKRTVSEKYETKAANEMSSEEFRHTVEAFIERQQRFLREEEEFSAMVSLKA